MSSVFKQTGLVILGSLLLVGCDATIAPMSPAEGAEGALAQLGVNGDQVQARGAGRADLTFIDVFPAQVNFTARQHTDGHATGELRYRINFFEGIPDILEGGTAEFKGRITCVSVNLEEGRAWIGGVITQNTSTQPFYRDDPVSQVGKDIWFRVLDASAGMPDRTTFPGFEGSGDIITSQEYCDAQIWPDDNERTHPFAQGGVQVPR